MNKRRLLMILTAFSLLLSIGGGILYAMPKTSVTNNYEMGIVDIELDEFQKVNGMEELYSDESGLNVLPAQKISKIPRIRCDGNDCYIRAKVTFLNTEYLGEQNLYGISEEWQKAGDEYYYYKKVLHTGEDVDLFQGLQMPVNFPQSEECKKFYINVDAEAVQSANFSPDYDSENPWGDIDIQLCGKEGMYDISTFKEDESNDFEIEYQGASDALIRNKEDFFTNLPFFMPGDTHSDVAKIENNSSRAIDLYFYTEEVSKEETDLLDRIQLEIVYKSRAGKTEVYKGPLRSKKLEDPIMLAEILPKEEGSFCFSLYVPEELDNQYTLLKDKVKWVFYTEYEDAGKSIFDIARTGDTSKLGLWMLIAGILLITGVFFASDKKKEKCVKK